MYLRDLVVRLRAEDAGGGRWAMDVSKLLELWDLGRRLARSRGKLPRVKRDSADAEKLARAFERGRKLAQSRNPKREAGYVPPAWAEEEAGPEGGVIPRAWRGLGPR